MTALSDLVDSGVVGIGELDALEVGLDARGVGALGEHNVAAAKTPGNQDLGEGVAALLRDVVQGGVLADALAGGGDLVLGSQRRVGLGHDVVLEAVLHQLLVGQEGVDFNLVEVRLDLGVLEELLQAFNGPVGDTDSPGLLVFVQLLHGLPCGLGVFGQVLQNNVLHAR